MVMKMKYVSHEEQEKNNPNLIYCLISYSETKPPESSDFCSLSAPDPQSTEWDATSIS